MTDFISVRHCEERSNLHDGITEVFRLTVSLGGTLSGEHGIGLVQKRYMPIALDNAVIELQKGIKKLFDPNLILNPGKMFE